MDLERELSATAVEWPATPQFRLELPRRRRRWPLVAAIALAAIAAVFAVPQSRGAILRFFDIGADRIQFVGTLPRAEERPLGAGLGEPTSVADAKTYVPALLLPKLDPPPTLYRSGDVVSLLFTVGGQPVLLSELRGEGVFLKKIAATGTGTSFIEVRPREFGVWISGKPHALFFPREPARLAGNTLVWQGFGTTYRLEGPGLSKRGALELAKSLVNTP
jgi:hypothetical protein